MHEGQKVYEEILNNLKIAAHIFQFYENINLIL